MKLIDDFFTILSSSNFETGFVTTIKLNPDHLIYSGHFPGHPVTPGVVQMQIVHELLENHLGKKLKLIAMPQCKFVEILNPEDTPGIGVNVEYKLQNNLLHINAYGNSGDNIFFKLNSIYE